MGAPQSAESVLNEMRSVGKGLSDFLFIAACDGDDVILKYLISHGASLASISGELGTVLNVVVYGQKAGAVDLL